jgi:hypothetical protein
MPAIPGPLGTPLTSKMLRHEATVALSVEGMRRLNL